MKKIKHLISFFVVFLQVFPSQVSGMTDEVKEGSPAISQKFIFDSLHHETDDPDSYTLACFDSTMIPATHKPVDLKYRHEFNDVKEWLRFSLLTEVDVKKEDQLDHKKLTVVKRETSSKEPYYIVQLHLRSCASASEKFTARLWGTTIQEREDLRYSASMLIFPQPQSTHALAYLFGKWDQLHNPYSVVHDWGLRLAASAAIFSDRNIKTLIGKNNFDPNPTSRKETKQRLAPIESFALEVGTEGLLKLTILPQYAIRTVCQRLVAGSDWYKFFLSPVQGEGKGDTLGALMKMGKYLYDIFSNNPKVHPKLRFYIDDEIRDEKRRQTLNQGLLALLKAKQAKCYVFPANEIWKLYGTSITFSFLDNKNQKYLLDALEGEDFNLDSLIALEQRKRTFNAPLGRLIYTLPIEFDGSFYRFDRGRWFKVDSSRFESIIRKLRSPNVKTSLPALFPYTLDDALGSEGLYQEDRYNRRVVFSEEGQKAKAILLDRLNIYLGGQGNKFEFGDILIQGNNGRYYIIHVKRKEAGDLDHHRAQVERTADYLGTELNKSNAKLLLLQACVNGLYFQHGISSNKVKGQGKRLTHGERFRDLFTKNKKGPKETWDNFLKNKILCNTVQQARTTLGKFKILLRSLDLSFFETHQEDLFIGLDALCDCNKKEKPLKEEEIKDFLEALKQLIELRKILFPSGTLTSATRKKTTIVMAVIDDRYIEAIRKKTKDLEKLKKEKKPKADITEASKELADLKESKRDKETEVFKKQHLWGLDHTLQHVQKHGFHFKLVVVNENKDRENWDAFGVVKATPVEMEESESTEPDETESSEQNKSIQSTSKSKGKKNPSSQVKEGAEIEENESETFKVAQYRYTPTDINRLLHVPLSHDIPREADYKRFSLSGAPDGDEAESLDIVHCLNKVRYVLPPIHGHVYGHEHKSPYEVLVELLSDTFFPHPLIIKFPPEELIIPFNPGNHWVTIHILIPPQNTQDIEVRYIDSLEGVVTKSSLILQSFLKGKYLGRKVIFTFLVKNIQPDSVSCGAITVDNIKALFRGMALPDKAFIPLQQMIEMKLDHQNYLKERGLEFDF